jgi:SAM-dependent methyltransferase
MIGLPVETPRIPLGNTSLEGALAEMERTREAYWRRYPRTSPIRLHWRALAVRHAFHVLPGESILELGAGSGIWTEYLQNVLRGENPLTLAVFNDDFARAAREKNIPNASVTRVASLDDLPAESFDYVVGTGILCHRLYAQNLRALYRLLKPGGQLFFFEANYWNPQVFVKTVVPAVRHWAGDARCQCGLRRYRLMQVISQQGFTEVQIIPYDILHPRAPASILRGLQSLAFLLEHTPVVKEFCGTLYIWARKPGSGQFRRAGVDLANNPGLFDSTSVVVPCHNEEMNIPGLVSTLLQLYGRYIHEILIVNDNSSDRTAEVTNALSRMDPRVKLIDRKPPNGVGRALRDGYAAAKGRLILTMDCDFALIVPELRDLFAALEEGYDGAIGSRFSHESILINYPFFKILCNRSFHLLVNLVLRAGVRDISNNLKLYRAEILKNLRIEEHHFAANVETGLKPILAGHRIREVPISWVNRTLGMGKSSFAIAGVSPGYARALWNIVREIGRDRRLFSSCRATASAARTGPPHA